MLISQDWSIKLCIIMDAQPQRTLDMAPSASARAFAQTVLPHSDSSQGHVPTMAVIPQSVVTDARTPTRRRQLYDVQTAKREAHPLARGDMIWGWSIKKAGLRHLLSRYSPTSLSSSRAVLCGGGQSTFFSSHCRAWRSMKAKQGLSGVITHARRCLF